MAVPVSQMWTVASYVLRQKLAGRKRYPLVLMLEPLFRCNLACAGCGKIQYPAHILKTDLSPEDCFKAVDECGAPMVSIPGGEPLMHPEIDEIVDGLLARKKYVYLCTNALLLKEKLHLFKPSKYLSFSVHVDGQKEHHDFSVCREGGYELALDGIRAAVDAGFRVTTNTTLFDGADPNSVREFFDEMMDAGVEGMMVSPGYSYDKAPDQKHFMGRARIRRMFRAMLSNRKKTWRFNQSPLFLEYLMGKRNYQCTPWGMPTYNIFGWQKPCYLLQDGYAESYKELMETTEWASYGTESGNPQCANCMVHCGYEPSSVDDTFGSLRGFVDTVKATFSLYPDKDALGDLEREVRPVHSYNPLVKINSQIDERPAPGASRRKPRMSGREHGHDPAPHHSALAASQPHVANPHVANPHVSDDLEVVPGIRARKPSGMDPATCQRSRRASGHRKSFRLSRRRDHHPHQWLRYHGISFRPSHWAHAGGFRGTADACDQQQRQRPPSHPLFRNRQHRLHRTRHRSRQKLRSLGKKILGKAGERRKEYFPRA